MTSQAAMQNRCMHRMLRSRLVIPLFIFLSFATLATAQTLEKSFNLPADAAEKTLRLFSAQSGLPVLFPTEVTKGVRTEAVRGKFPPREALDKMLAGTVLLAVQDEKTGSLTIKRHTAASVAPRAGARADDGLKKNETLTPQTQEPMKRNKLLTRLGAAIALLVAPADPADAQTAPKGDNPANTLTEEKVVELSPFEVSATSDDGYAARETLAGTRFKTELKDVPSQVSVMTAEFLEDIGTVEIEDAFRYSINIENQSEFQGRDTGDFEMGTVNIIEGNRVRGMSSTGRTHDFFQTYVPGNTYNTERITFSSGPNSILFGNGNPGGIVDTSFKRARLQRPKYSVSLRGDSHDSLQASVDLNHPIIKDKLALRIAGMKSDNKHWRAPAGEKAERIYGSITFKPFPSTTIRGWYEDVTLNRISARNTRVGDSVTPWIEAGRPLFDNSFASPMANPTASNPIFSRNTVQTNVLLFGATATPDSPLMRWGSAGASVAANQPVYSVVTKGPGAAPYQTGTDSYNYSLADASLSPNEISSSVITRRISSIPISTWSAAPS
jgi:outer membrane receptor protein involved in Fe transport